MNITYLNKDKLNKEFIKCCVSYDSLKMAIAWVGNFNNIIPFNHLQKVKKIKAIIGIDFERTHPDSLLFLYNIDADFKIYKSKNEIFHPKLFLFSKQNKFRLFIGSSNFTFAGFFKNQEANLSIEFTKKDNIKLLDSILYQINSWYNDKNSFKFTLNWYKHYKKLYLKRYKNRKSQEFTNEVNIDDFSTVISNWILEADWEVYYNQIEKSFNLHKLKYKEDKDYLLKLLENYKIHLSIPWHIDYFDDLEKRKMMGGMDKYGWLGHVAASGNVRKILKNGTKQQKHVIINSINEIASLKIPVDWDSLHIHANKLVSIGPTMKVWSRFFCIVHPDLFCTIASDSVRKKFSLLFKLYQNYLSTVEGYISLIKKIHQLKWFKSIKPMDNNEEIIWNNRAALLDLALF